MLAKKEQRGPQACTQPFRGKVAHQLLSVQGWHVDAAVNRLHLSLGRGFDQSQKLKLGRGLVKPRGNLCPLSGRRRLGPPAPLGFQGPARRGLLKPLKPLCHVLAVWVLQ